jgi:polyisoprenoid-binding protein YceI
MRIPFLKYICILAVLGSGLATANAQTVEANAKAAIVFKGTSTLHDFEGSVSTRPFTAFFSADPATGQLRVTATAALNVSEMNTDNKQRDKNMMKLLEQKNFSTISATLQEATIPTTGTNQAVLRVKIRDIEQNVTATLSEWKRDGNHASCKMTFQVSLTAFGLKPPSIMGVIRVGDTVNIECTIEGAVK